jgi:plastocyanin
MLVQRVAVVTAVAVSFACAGDGGTNPPSVTSVVITAPAAGPSFQTLGRTVQFSAEPRDGATALTSVTVTWTSSATAVATVSGTGLVTATGNGTTQIRAVAQGVQSDPITVTVAQFADTTVITPGAVAMGAIGSTRQLTAASADSGGAAIPGSPVITWTAAGNGATATVSATGLVTAVGVGSSDTAVASIGGILAKSAITVTQVPASILVASTGSDTLRTTGRTKTFTATVRDSQLNTIGGALVTWGSTSTATATINGAGVATAVADGNTTIQATSGAALGTKLLTVRRYSAVFDLAPLNDTITTNGGNTPFSIDARDSVDTALPATWQTRNAGIATVAPTTGANIVATATGNGMTFIIVSAGTRTDSAVLHVSGQIPLAMNRSVTVGDFFFRSDNNNTQNAAIDTIGAGGTITWNFNPGNSHSVESTGSPSFSSGPVQSGGTLQRTFANVGTYQYLCLLHGSMTGRIVVR